MVRKIYTKYTQRITRHIWTDVHTKHCTQCVIGYIWCSVHLTYIGAVYMPRIAH